MRLKTIKLNGFKSFPEPAALPLLSNLTAVVGPNGCGKSNVVDAIRWVLGESSARQLRGDSMSDVIFNGTTSRHPLGQASVELVFDNSERKLGGAYAAYDEISVKRQVSRDGQSVYWLNSSRCRRRDITDLFLGTGLGARSYSIIEQGMISRVIDARPDELRGYIEEAAGISRYRERRRETENRISHTRDNMARVNDLRTELQRQQQSLERQSRNAERYRELSARERTTKATLLTLRMQRQQAGVEEGNRLIQIAETGLERRIAELRHLQSELEKNRSAQHRAGEALSQAQADYYGLGAEISTVQKVLEHGAQEQQRLVREQDSLQDRIRRHEQDRRKTELALQALEKTGRETEQSHQSALREHRVNETALETARSSLRALEAELAGMDRKMDGPRSLVQEAERRGVHLRAGLEGNAKRHAELREERSRITRERSQTGLLETAARMETLQQQQAVLETTVSQAEEQVRDSRNRLEQCQAEQTRLHGELQLLQGKIDSLQSWREGVLSHGEAAEAWLRQTGLREQPKLGSLLRVDPKWHRAVEMVLGSLFGAIPVEDLSGLVTGGMDIAGTGVTLVAFAPGGEAAPDGRHTHSRLSPLASHLTAPWDLRGYLQGIYAVESLQEGWSELGRLQPGESMITPDGIWFSGSWIRTLSGEQETRLFDTNQQLSELESERDQLRGAVDRCQGEAREVQGQLDVAESGLAGRREDLRKVVTRWADARAELGVMRAQQDREEERLKQIARENERLERAADEDRKALERVERDTSQARAMLESLLAERAEVAARVEQTRQDLGAIQQKFDRSRDAWHDMALALQKVTGEIDENRRALQRLRDLETGDRTHLQRLQQDLEQRKQPQAETEEQLQRLLSRRTSSEQALQQARGHQQEIEEGLREQDRQRMSLERTILEGREELERLRIRRQEFLTQIEGLREQLRSLGVDREALEASLTLDQTEAELSGQLDALAQQIARLGPVNLAAIEEFEQLRERQEYLNRQYTDLEEALATMETAMRKMDRETRALFRTTFDRVNQGLKGLFPKLFGGGHAYLDMRGDEVLDAEIHIMAQPPGKKNTSIQQLSGGEKALTAISLIFAIFQLNPAPFCVLDEVDAPLDDVNVGRFSELVREMSGQVQFLFVTHNKGTMEIAHQLTGVTMAEVGVSRLVAVDLDDAVQLTGVSA